MLSQIKSVDNLPSVESNYHPASSNNNNIQNRYESGWRTGRDLAACRRIQGLTSSPPKVCLRDHPHYKHIYSARSSEHAVGCSTEVQQLFGKWFLERELSVCWRPLTLGNKCPISSCTEAEEEQTSSLHKVFFQGSRSSLKGVDVPLHPIF